MLRRRKADVETELPERTDRNHFVPLSELQKQNYGSHEQQVLKLVNIAQRRPLTKQEQDKLQRELAMMRMICDTNYILDAGDRICPKLAEIEKLLDECAGNDAKVIIFSEWERMLELVRDHCDESGIGYAWHTGTVPQQRRRAEINAFKDDPKCRVFLSTDAGATGRKRIGEPHPRPSQARRGWFGHWFAEMLRKCAEEPRSAGRCVHRVEIF